MRRQLSCHVGLYGVHLLDALRPTDSKLSDSCDLLPQAAWMFCVSRGVARMPSSVKMLSTKLLLGWRGFGSETEAG